MSRPTVQAWLTRDSLFNEDRALRQGRTFGVGILAAILVVLVMLPAVAAAQATTTTVNTLLDGDDGACNAGNCTLREALRYPLNGSLVIVPAGEYVVADELFVERSLTIRGAGARTTTIRVSPPVSMTSRVLFINSEMTVDLSGVRITGGNNTGSPGGGIEVNSGASLTLSDSAVEGNTADYGGGIASSGNLVVLRTTIARNHAVGGETQARGGGIQISSSGTATIENSTVSGNTAVETFDPDQGNGGGIYTSGNLDLHNVTIAENSAADGTSGAGGGLFQDFEGDARRTVSTNTLVARNAGGNCAGTGTDPIESTNGLSDELGAPTCLVVSGPANGLVADTRLGPLANNGGATDTHALLADSLGVDGGGAPCPAVDQRGVSRPLGLRCDVGAYEFAPALPAPPQPLSAAAAAGGGQVGERRAEERDGEDQAAGREQVRRAG